MKKKSKIHVIVSVFICLAMLLGNMSGLTFIYPAEIRAYDSMEYGIDVSKYQEEINWSKVASTGIDFAISRIGTTNFNQETLYKDQYFDSNYEGSKSNGLKTGTYYFTSSYTLEGMKQNARDCISFLDGKKFDYPVFIDVEMPDKSTKQVALGKNTLTSYLLEALDILKDAGYSAGVYSNKSFLETYIDVSRIKAAGYQIWMAQYPSGTTAVDPKNYDKSGLCDFWQYSDRGKVDGINGYVDMNVRYTSSNSFPGVEDTSYSVPLTATANAKCNTYDGNGNIESNRWIDAGDVCTIEKVY
ncbi:MAG: GH25 family lysozyme, partial [Oscillospiraceae bacterium]|nr:GH25 family lysozyme [Oscillospiraceae bacterium]